MATLNKFGVPLGPLGVEGRGGILQPKLKYRYRVRTVAFGPTNDQINLTQQVMNITKPKVAQEEVVIDDCDKITQKGSIAEATFNCY